ncbi:MAG: hypothetical protein ABJE47_19275 [bacterium]
MVMDMLALESERWTELHQAHGTGEDIPRLLQALDAIDGDRERAELWFGVWSTLCPDGRLYSAAYAAVPHLMAIGTTRGAQELVAALHVIAEIESLRHAGGAPGIPADLVPAYAATVESMPQIVAASVNVPWDAPTAQILCAALAVGKRQPALGRAILSLGETE